MTAFVFPGQGSQNIGMGKDFHESFPCAREVFEQASDSIGENMAALCFNSDEETLSLTANAQPAILTVSIAILSALRKETDLKPDFVAGHSLGEYSALVAAGALDFTDAVRIVRKRGELMQKAVPPGIGAMAAVMGLESGEVEKICSECSDGNAAVSPANYNSPLQTVVSGHAEAVRKASAIALGRGARRAVLLKVSAPFHCPLMKPASEDLSPMLDGISVSDIKIPVVTNVGAKENRKSEIVKDTLLRQIVSPVRWSESVEYMKSRGVAKFIEVGPGKALCGLIKRTIKDVETSSLEIKEHLHRM